MHLLKRLLKLMGLMRHWLKHLGFVNPMDLLKLMDSKKLKDCYLLIYLQKPKLSYLLKLRLSYLDLLKLMDSMKDLLTSLQKPMDLLKHLGKDSLRLSY